jgi:hypothetical protein
LDVLGKALRRLSDVPQAAWQTADEEASGAVRPMMTTMSIVLALAAALLVGLLRWRASARLPPVAAVAALAPPEPAAPTPRTARGSLGQHHVISPGTRFRSPGRTVGK